MPGPGHYTSTIEKSASGVTIGQRHGTSIGPKSTVNTPGPGQYNPNVDASKLQSHASAIGNEKRPDITGVAKDAKNWPGPGQHGFSGSISLNKGSKIGTGQRSQIGGGGLKTPGPGNYSINVNATRAEQPRYSIKGGKLRGTSLVMSDEPGPGQYTTKPLEKEGYMKIGSEQRRDLAGPNSGKMPGPGNYNIDKYNLSHSYGFGKAERKTLDGKKAGQTPGPGQYMLPTYVGQLNAYQKPAKVN